MNVTRGISIKKWGKRIIFYGFFAIGIFLSIDCQRKGLLLGEWEVAWAGTCLLISVMLGLWWKQDDFE